MINATFDGYRLEHYRRKMSASYGELTMQIQGYMIIATKITASIVAFVAAAAIPILLQMSPDVSNQVTIPLFLSMSFAIWPKCKDMKSRLTAGLTGVIVSFIIAMAVIFAPTLLAQQTGSGHVAANSSGLLNILSLVIPAAVVRRMLIDVGQTRMSN